MFGSKLPRPAVTKFCKKNGKEYQGIGRAKKTELGMAEYFHRNFAITTSGVEDPLALDYSIRKLGVDNVMWAIDYPYQPTEPAVRFMDEARKAWVGTWSQSGESLPLELTRGGS